jgi:hypothetical protein
VTNFSFRPRLIRVREDFGWNYLCQLALSNGPGAKLKRNGTSHLSIGTPYIIDLL